MSISDYLRANEAKLKKMRRDGEPWETIAALIQKETGEEVNLASLRKTFSRLFGGSETPPKVEKPQKVSIKKVERKPPAKPVSDDHFSGYETLSDEDIFQAPTPPKPEPKNHSEAPQTDESQEINLDVILSSDADKNEVLDLKKLLEQRDAEIKKLKIFPFEEQGDEKHPNYIKYLKACVNGYVEENIRLFRKNSELENTLKEVSESELLKKIERLEKALANKDNLISEMQKAHEKRWKMDFEFAVKTEVNKRSAELHPTYQRRFQLFYDKKIKEEVELL